MLPEAPGERRLPIEPAKIGLRVFLAVVGALFALLISAYFMRMTAADWWATPVPRLLWVNTAVLALSSAAVEWAKFEARRGRSDVMRVALVMGLATAVLFLAGQVMAWRELVAAGYVLADNPANSFFYMLTGLHGLHILGGLAVLGRTTSARLRRSLLSWQAAPQRRSLRRLLAFHARRLAGSLRTLCRLGE